MDLSNTVEFSSRLVTLSEVFDVKLSPARQALYFEALRDLSFQIVVKALNQALKVCTFFPKPAELRTIALGDTEDHAERSWMALRKATSAVGGYASLVTSDPALGEAIVAVFGGWPQVCAVELTPEMWSSKRKEFGRVFRTLRDRSLVGWRYLPGICERHNGVRPDVMRFIPVNLVHGSGTIEPLSLEHAEALRGQLNLEGETA